MAALGRTDGTAADRARAALSSGGGGSRAAATANQIPIRTGGFSYQRRENEGAFDGDIHTNAPRVLQEIDKDIVERFNLTDEGVNAAFGTWYSFDDEQRAALSKKMWFLGLIKDPNDFDGAYDVWKKAITHAGRFAMTGKEMDPNDVLDLMGDAESGATATKQKGGPVTRRQIDLTDPETAKAWVQEAFSQSMGRKAEDAEVRALVDALGARERANPSIQTTTPTKWDDQGNPIDSTTVTSGGFSSDAFIQNQVDADPEATAHQAAGELFPALLQALGAGV